MSLVKRNAIFAKKVRTLAELYGSQAKLAKALGITPASINDWVQGRSRPSSKRLKKLAELSGLPVAYWADDSISPSTGSSKIAESLPKAYVAAAPVLNYTGAKDDKQGARRNTETDEERKVAYVLDAIDPRCIVVQGNSGWNFTAQDQIVVIDAARPIAPHDKSYDGKPVMAIVRGKIAIRIRNTDGEQRIYTPIHSGGLQEHGAIAVPVEDVEFEYPVVSILIEPKRVDPRDVS